MKTISTIYVLVSFYFLYPLDLIYAQNCTLDACISCESNVPNSANKCNAQDQGIIWLILQAKFIQAYLSLGMVPPIAWSVTQNRRHLLVGPEREHSTNLDELEDGRDLGTRPTCSQLCLVYGTKYCANFGCYSNNRRRTEVTSSLLSSHQGKATEQRELLCQDWMPTELKNRLTNGAYSGYNDAYHSGLLSRNCSKIIYNYACTINVLGK